MQPTITQQEAAERADAYTRAAIAQLPAEAKFTKYEADINNCSLPSDNGPQGRVIAFTSYETKMVPVSEFNQYFDKIKDYWTRNGFIVLDDSRPKDWYLWVQHQPDEFRMSIQGNDKGLLTIGAVSPCVWPNGNPPG